MHVNCMRWIVVRCHTHHCHTVTHLKYSLAALTYHKIVGIQCQINSRHVKHVTFNYYDNGNDEQNVFLSHFLHLPSAWLNFTLFAHSTFYCTPQHNLLL